jgi:metacaspase-1
VRHCRWFVIGSLGINYVGQQGQLSGCHNDVEAIKEYIVAEGYSDSEDNMMVLLDDGTHSDPTHANIVEGFK